MKSPTRDSDTFPDSHVGRNFEGCGLSVAPCSSMTLPSLEVSAIKELHFFEPVRYYSCPVVPMRAICGSDVDIRLDRRL